MRYCYQDMAKSEKTFYEILTINRDATAAQVSDAFRRLVREHHPDRFKDPVKKSEAESFLKDVTEAYNTLSKQGLREEYDKSLTRPQSQIAQKSLQEQVRELLQGGVARYKSGDYTSALAMFDHALRIEPSSDLSLFYSGMIRLKNPHWRTQGTQQIEKAIELNPYNSVYVAEYADFLLENGMQLRAQRLLEAAIENNPTDEKLKALLAQARGEDKSSGFSLFRKK
jgi:curved DNA-binding protein CbpA